ncbi:MAG: hypothetical protein JRE40_16145 [Deltaproteobacteria bacterium]|nr:hypothetical protein [Deltaproteobacteria bacterium]
MAMIAGATPDIEAHGQSMGELGERFMYYRVDSDDDDTRSKMMDKARAMEGLEKEAREEISIAVRGVVSNCKNMDFSKVKMEKCYGDWLANLVDLTTNLRTPVKRNYYRREVIEYTPHKEGPGRMYKACQVLLKSLAVVRGRQEVNEDDYAVAVKICIDSIQSIRREAVKALAKTYGRGGVRPKDIAQLTGYQSTESVGYHLADLSALGLVDRWIDKYKAKHLNAPFLYEMKKKTYDKLQSCGMLDVL